ILDPRLVDLDHLAHRLRLSIIVHNQLLSAILKEAPAAGKVRKTLYVITRRDRRLAGQASPAATR
ncbi:MAG: hypothetical protein AAF526_04945, partial [Pseudomonadota bacterium]